MSTIQDIFQAYAGEYLEKYSNDMPQQHKKVLHAITNCHSTVYGTAVYYCPTCSKTHFFNGSCGNRHCPMCQHQKSENWLKKQLQKKLPCNYFMLTVTVPQELHSIMRSNQQVCYGALFDSTHSAIKTLAADKRFLGTPYIGMTTALHTWGSQIQYHPHLHIIIPGGGISKDKTSWKSSRQDMVVHTNPLKKMIRGKYKAAMIKAGLYEYIPRKVWQKKWVVHNAAVGNGDNALRYLARYVFRVAISNNRIKSVNHKTRTVTISYKDKKQNRWRKLTLDVMEFMRRFLQHVLPCGFMKIRHIGFLNGNSKLTIENIRKMIALHEGIIMSAIVQELQQTPSRPCCEHCGTELILQAFIPSVQRRKTG